MDDTALFYVKFWGDPHKGEEEGLVSESCVPDDLFLWAPWLCVTEDCHREY